MYPTEVIVNYDILRENIKALQALRPQCHLVPVVKSDAYGHGLVQASRAFLEGGVERLAVFRVEEALELRRNGIESPFWVLLGALPYEAELAVILGRDALNVPAEEAYDYVFGYTIINDVSSRDLQARHKQFYFAKSLDTFTCMGPWIVTADDLPCPPVLHISSKVNGELRQDSSTGNMIFDIPYIIEELSSGMMLRAGTVISTGTPSGVGMGFTPPKFMKSGDTVECIIEGIGSLTNHVK